MADKVKCLSPFSRDSLLRLILGFFLGMSCFAQMNPAFNGNGSAEEKSRLFLEANRFYEQAKYEQAIQSYEKLLSEDRRTPAILYNLGNAYFKSGRLGRAILCLERAHRLDPADPEIVENLLFVRSRRLDKIEEPEPSFLLSGLIRADRVLSYRQKMWAVFLLWLLANGFWACRRAGSREIIRRISSWGISLSLLLIVCLVLSLIIHSRQENKTEAIVVVESSRLFSGPGETNSELTVIHEGIQVEIRQQTADWSQVVLPNGWNGWVLRRHLEIL